jgi:hypothetical protein
MPTQLAGHSLADVRVSGLVGLKFRGVAVDTDGGRFARANVGLGVDSVVFGLSPFRAAVVCWVMCSWRVTVGSTEET